MNDGSTVIVGNRVRTTADLIKVGVNGCVVPADDVEMLLTALTIS